MSDDTNVPPPAKAKKKTNWKLLGIILGCLMIFGIINNVIQNNARSKEAEADLQKKKADSADFAAFTARHDSMMANNKSYRDSVHKAEQDQKDRWAAEEKTKLGISFDEATAGLGIKRSDCKEIETGGLMFQKGVIILSFHVDTDNLRMIDMGIGVNGENGSAVAKVVLAILVNSVGARPSTQIMSSFNTMLVNGGTEKSWTVGEKTVKLSFDKELSFVFLNIKKT